MANNLWKKKNVCARPNPGPRFPMSCPIFVFSELRKEVIVCFTDIG